MNVEIKPAQLDVSLAAPRLDAAVEPPILRILPDPYAGPYEVTPAEDDVVLQTNGLIMAGDVTVHPTPAYDGPYAVTPSDQPQTLPTTGKRMTADVEIAAGGGSATLIEKSIADNGVYTASDFDADGFSEVDVSVPQGVIVPAGFSYYNGYLLPDAPTDETYKYFFIRRNNKTGMYDCILGTKPWYSRSNASLDNWALTFTGQDTAGSRQYSVPQSGDRTTTATDWGEPTSSVNYYGTTEDRKLIFANHDIKINNGTNVLYKRGYALK